MESGSGRRDGEQRSHLPHLPRGRPLAPAAVHLPLRGHHGPRAPALPGALAQRQRQRDLRTLPLPLQRGTRPRQFREWLRTANVRRSFLGDVVCFALLSPLAFLCGVLCLHGAARQVLLRKFWESIGLTALAFLLFAVYSTWAVFACRYHYQKWKKWRETNPWLKVLLEPRDSCPDETDDKGLPSKPD
ncbi:hypothetical protein HPB48_002118 [Haemaphysalis longicornis]|uniref:Uncharacterized protein n=1 Tax=Haemaphysalis longicornis TaxID=44386 RepID=A0A9J6FJP5_HAELO|nr:hypothetical protein HPB48_002118 [Haemaphysalis longicornis]